MPTYAYTCTACNHSLEVRQSFTDDALTECPQCDGRLRKVFNSVGVVFKGSGFYRTDSRADAKGSDAKGSDAKGSGAGDGSKDAGKSSDGASSGAEKSSTPAAASAGSSSSGSSSSGGSSSGGSSSGTPAAKPAAS